MVKKAIIIFFICFPLISFGAMTPESCYEDTTAGTTDTNGIYHYYGTNFFFGTTNLSFINDHGIFLLECGETGGLHYFNVETADACDTGSNLYYGSHATLNEPMYMTWTATTGSSPIPVFTEVTCPEEGGSETTASTTTATTTDELRALGSLNFGLAILISIASLTLIGFAFNTLNNRKKPWKT